MTVSKPEVYFIAVFTAVLFAWFAPTSLWAVLPACFLFTVVKGR